MTTYQNRLLFSLSTNVVDAVVNEEFDSEDTHIYKSFHDIGSTEEFYQYLQSVFHSQVYTDATGFNSSDVVSTSNMHCEHPCVRQNGHLNAHRAHCLVSIR